MAPNQSQKWEYPRRNVPLSISVHSRRPQDGAISCSANYSKIKNISNVNIVQKLEHVICYPKLLNHLMSNIMVLTTSMVIFFKFLYFYIPHKPISTILQNPSPRTLLLFNSVFVLLTFRNDSLF